jgi:TetR/AcrR family transcriptional regulator
LEKIIAENTEQKILSSAEQIFLKDGYFGSRMQDIADLAGINKAMLHYYFRSKDKLFEKIFSQNVDLLFPQIEELIQSENKFIDVIHVFIEKYMAMLMANPYLPLFIISTINNPTQSDFIEKIPYHLNKKFALKYYKDKAKGLVNEVDAFQFIVSVMAMCLFPFMAKPIIKKASGIGDEGFNDFIEARIIELKKYVSAIIIPIEKNN